MWIVGEDMPQETNRITLNAAVNDQHGLPVPNVHFDDHPNDVAMRDHGYRRAELAVRGGRRRPARTTRRRTRRRTTWAPAG